MPTALVAIAKLAVVWPAGTVTVLGIETEVEVVERATDVPEGPAGPLNLTVPVEGAPPWTVDGFKLSELREAGLIVKVAFCF